MINEITTGVVVRTVALSGACGLVSGIVTIAGAAIAISVIKATKPELLGGAPKVNNNDKK